MVTLTNLIFYVLNFYWYVSNVDGVPGYSYDLESAPALFLNFIKDYNKQYESHEELLNRFKWFKDNLKKINDLNKKNPYTTFGITSLTDQSEEERTQMLSCITADVSDTPKMNIEVTVPVESELDWRDKGAVTEVKDQHVPQWCGSCWAFSTTGEIEGQNAIKNGKLISLSAQEIVDCSKSNNGCQGGYPNIAMNDIASLGGLMSETSYPYVAEQSKCRFNPDKAVVKIKGGSKLNVDENSLAGALAQHGPLSVLVFVNSEWFLYNGSDIFVSDNCEGHFNHAALLVGYKSDYWIIKNSWGADWGDKGYIKLKRGVGMCKIGLYTVASTL